MGKRDDLRGLKDVIVGRLIPAGTGLAYHQAHKAMELAERLERATQAFEEPPVTEQMTTASAAEPAEDADSEEEVRPMVDPFASLTTKLRLKLIRSCQLNPPTQQRLPSLMRIAKVLNKQQSD